VPSGILCLGAGESFAASCSSDSPAPLPQLGAPPGERPIFGAPERLWLRDALRVRAGVSLDYFIEQHFYAKTSDCSSQ
jgi:hypothetical protein